MNPAMDVRVLDPIKSAEGIDYQLGLLRRGSIVEIHQRAAVDPFTENGEVLSYRLYVQDLLGVRLCRIDRAGNRKSAQAAPSRSRTSRSSSSRTGSRLTSAMTSAANA